MNNAFVQSLGWGAAAYILLVALDLILDAVLSTLQAFARWYQYWGASYAWQTAIGVAVIVYIVASIRNSRSL